MALQASPAGDDSPCWWWKRWSAWARPSIHGATTRPPGRALQRGRDGARALDDPRLQALALVQLSTLASTQGAYAEALTLAQDEALPLAQAVGGAALATPIWRVGGAQWQLGDL